MKKYRVTVIRHYGMSSNVESWGYVSAEDADGAEREFLRNHRYLVHGCFSVKTKEV